MKTEFKKTGQWSEVQTLLQDLKGKVEAGVQVAMMKSGLEMERFSVKAIQQQNMGWKNSEYWTDKKKALGYSEKVLVMTSTYIQAITSFAQRKKGKFTVNAGVKRGIYEDDGTEIANIAAVLEFGRKTDKTKKYPLWVPCENHIRTWIVATGILKNEIEKKLKGGGYSVSRQGSQIK